MLIPIYKEELLVTKILVIIYSEMFVFYTRRANSVDLYCQQIHFLNM